MSPAYRSCCCDRKRNSGYADRRPVPKHCRWRRERRLQAPFAAATRVAGLPGRPGMMPISEGLPCAVWLARKQIRNEAFGTLELVLLTPASTTCASPRSPVAMASRSLMPAAASPCVDDQAPGVAANPNQPPRTVRQDRQSGVGSTPWDPPWPNVASGGARGS